MLIQGEIIEKSLDLLVDFPAIYYFILCGIWVVDLIYEARRREGIIGKVYDDDWDFDVTTVLKLLTTLFCISGIFITFIGAVGLITNQITRTISYTLLLIIGILTCVKPLNDIPLASILGILAATGVGLIMMTVISIFNLYISITTLVILIVVLIIIFIVVAIIAKFWLLPLEILSKIVSWPIVGMIGALFMLIMGILLSVGVIV